MAERSYPRDWTDLLPQEADRWVQAGLISPEQRAAILGLYPAPEVEGRDRTILIITILGSLLVGLGVILFIASNWQALLAPVKVGLILGAVVGVYAAGYHLQYGRGDYPRLGHSLIFLGALFYGAGIWLIAQIFHLDSHFPTGFLLWALGVLPVAWVAQSRPILYLSTLLLVVWTVMEQAEFGSPNFLYPAMALGLLLPLARRLQTELAEAVVLLGLFLWLALNAVRAVEHQSDYIPMVLLSLFIVYGCGLLALGLARIGAERAYLGVGTLLALAGAYLFTFDWHRSADATLHLVDALVAAPFALGAVLVCLGGLAAGIYRYWRRGEPGRLQVLPGIGAFVLAALGQSYLPDVPRMVLFNILLLAGVVGVVALGIQRRSGLLLNMGLVGFVIHILTRYFDLFFSALDRSIFFIAGGVLLLGGGWLLERNRRRWMRDWGGGNHAA